MSQMFRLFLITAIFSLFSLSSLLAKSTPSQLLPDAFVSEKIDEEIPQQITSYLKSKNEETAKVWIFFTDKAVFDKSGFEQKASSVQLSEKVLNRRKKVNRDYVLFVDLPVEKSYVEQIINMGAKHRRSSRWLNGASFEMSYEILEQVNSLPFVQSVKPMLGFSKDPGELDELLKTPPDAPEKSPDVLSYGSSFTQLNQINVPAVHEKGITGAGVTLCITDTGYRKTHEAFAQHFANGRVLSEYDFIFNDSETSNQLLDDPSQWNHGTLVWSASAGEMDGTIYGPAYQANILLAKTEDVRSETQVEEDNWVAALEWADSLGADVISTSLGYSDWYTQSDFDGNTAIITLAANTCASLGIVLCNSMGNSGPYPTSLSAPADAFDIIACGAVYSSGSLASFSSRGPTYDGRMKPEVCAMGVSTYSASTSGDNAYTYASGTSLSTPLVAGAACLLIQARPSFPPELIRLALMETANNAATPNNDYGWGIIDIDAALGWGATLDADIQTGDAPLTVNFSGASSLTVNSWAWTFGDGDISSEQNPTHIYTETGIYDVSLTIDTEHGPITDARSSYIFVYGDTLHYVSDSGFAGHEAVMSVELTNSQQLSEIRIPFKFFDSPKISFDSVTRGARTNYFEYLDAIAFDPWNSKYTFRLKADNGGGSPDLSIGSGEIMKIHFTIDQFELGGSTYIIDSSSNPYTIELSSPYADYGPIFYSGTIKATEVIRGDVNYDLGIDIADLVHMVAFAFNSGDEPVCLQAYDVNGDLLMDIEDITSLVEYMFTGGPPPVSP